MRQDLRLSDRLLAYEIDSADDRYTARMQLSVSQGEYIGLSMDYILFHFYLLFATLYSNNCVMILQVYAEHGVLSLPSLAKFFCQHPSFCTACLLKYY
jgi:hypothetical protein